MLNKIKQFFSRKPQSKEEKNLSLHNERKVLWDSQRGKLFKIAQLKKAYVSDSENIYFVYSDILTMPFERYEQLQRISLELECNLTADYIKEFNASLAEAVTQKNLFLIDQLQKNFESRFGQVAQDKLWLHYAMIFLVRHDENPYNYDEQAQAAKFKECQDDHNLRSFLMRFAH